MRSYSEHLVNKASATSEPAELADVCASALPPPSEAKFSRKAVIYLLDNTTHATTRKNIGHLLDGIARRLRKEASVIEIKWIIACYNVNKYKQEYVDGLYDNNIISLNCNNGEHLSIDAFLDVGDPNHPLSKGSILPDVFKKHSLYFQLDPNDHIVLVSTESHIRTMIKKFSHCQERIWFVDTESTGIDPQIKESSSVVLRSVDIVSKSQFRAEFVASLFNQRSHPPTSLIQAAYNGDLAAVEQFMRAPQDSDAPITAIEAACIRRHTRVVSYLLEHDPNAKLTPYLELFLKPSKTHFIFDWSANKDAKLSSIEDANNYGKIYHLNDIFDANKCSVSFYSPKNKLPDEVSSLGLKHFSLVHLEKRKFTLGMLQHLKEAKEAPSPGDAVVLVSGDKNVFPYLSALNHKGASIYLTKCRLWNQFTIHPQWSGTMDSHGLYPMEPCKQKKDFADDSQEPFNEEIGEINPATPISAAAHSPSFFSPPRIAEREIQHSAASTSAFF